MVELLIVAVMGLLVISAAATLGTRMGFAAPSLLVVAGIGASLLPFVPEVHVEPEWIPSGVLPPLLYSASVSMPSMNFRREFGAISGLSFVLVVVSSLALGAVFAWLIPGLGLAWGSRWARGSGRRPEATNPRYDLGAAESPARCQGRRKFQHGRAKRRPGRT